MRRGDAIARWFICWPIGIMAAWIAMFFVSLPFILGGYAAEVPSKFAQGFVGAFTTIFITAGLAPYHRVRVATVMMVFNVIVNIVGGYYLLSLWDQPASRYFPPWINPTNIIIGGVISILGSIAAVAVTRRVELPKEIKDESGSVNNA